MRAFHQASLLCKCRLRDLRLATFAAIFSVTVGIVNPLFAGDKLNPIPAPTVPASSGSGGEYKQKVQTAVEKQQKLINALEERVNALEKALDDCEARQKQEVTPPPKQ
jgi:hypothetical protein